MGNILRREDVVLRRSYIAVTKQAHNRQNVRLMDVIERRCERHPDIVRTQDPSETYLTCFS